MTQERIQSLAEALNADEELTKKIVEMRPADASAALAKKGYDFTADELVEFSEIVTKSNESGELDAEDLKNVSGGSLAFAVGVTVTVWVGVQIYKNWRRW